MAAPIASTTAVVAQSNKVLPMEAEMMVAATDGSQQEVVVVALEAAVRPVSPVTPEAMPVMGRTEGVVDVGPPDIAVVNKEADRELSLVLISGGSHSPMMNEPLLQWGSPQDPSSALFTLDDDIEGMERESLDNGITTMLDALNHARGALRDIIVPAS